MLTRLVAATVAVGSMAAVSTGAALASSPPATIQISSNAYLLSDGSALVTITYSCLPGFGGGPGEINGTLEQPQGLGSAATTATCDDHNHTTTLDFQPGPFVRGEAAANVTIGAGANESANSQAEVTIH